MKNQFVTYEIAKKLKELGFNEPCLTFWYNTPNGVKLIGINRLDPNEWDGFKNEQYQNTSSPLWQQVIDWLREKHKMHLYVEGCYPWFRYYINTEDDRVEGYKELEYEKAREQAILKALELITT